jgi:DNA (cytosine-5)-methyltransferase 1
VNEKPTKDHRRTATPTLGSLFAGIGGLDLGFERAGWRSVWQVEIDPIARAVLGHRFPDARQFEDVRHCGAANLSAVDCITAGFPCQDISTAGSCSARLGLAGARSGLFSEAMRIVQELQPRWLVLENVAALLHSQDCRDIETVVRTVADCGYMGFWRVLDAQYFGSPCRRRRIFLVAGLGRYPTFDLLADAAPVDSIPSSSFPEWKPRDETAWAGHTLCATTAPSQICLGGESLVAHPHGWHQMVERRRTSQDHGFCLGLDAANLAEAKGAGNAVAVQVAQWIAQKLLRS